MRTRAPSYDRLFWEAGESLSFDADSATAEQPRAANGRLDPKTAQAEYDAVDLTARLAAVPLAAAVVLTRSRVSGEDHQALGHAFRIPKRSLPGAGDERLSVSGVHLTARPSRRVVALPPDIDRRQAEVPQ